MFSFLKRKYKNTAFTFQYSTSLETICEDWNSILPQNHHLSLGHLLFLENNTNISGVYVQVFKFGQVVGNIYLQKVTVPVTTIGYGLKNFDKLKCIVKSIENVSCGLNFLICGNVFRPNQEGFFFRNDVTKEEVFESFLNYTETLENEIGFTGILIKECPSPLISEGKFKPIKQDVSMEMMLNQNWKNINDYVEDLDKKYRKRFLKIQQSAQEIEKRELNEADFKLTEIKESYFVNLKKALGDKLRIYGFFKDQELVAFTTHIYNTNQQLEIHYIGLNYEYTQRYNLYFNILQFGLEMAIKDSQKSLELGRTAHVAKASLGAKPSPNYNYVYFKKHIYSWSFQLFLRKIYNNIESEWQTRSPFATRAEVSQATP
jgi:hypothetical protein